MLLEGSKVLIYENGKYLNRNIENLKKNDIVVGAGQHLNKIMVIKPELYSRNNAIYTFENNGFRFLDTHPLMIRRENKNLWGIKDVEKMDIQKQFKINGVNVRTEKMKELIGNSNYREPADYVQLNVSDEYATIDGWQTLVPTEYTLKRNDGKRMYRLYTDGTQSAYVNGFLVGAYPSKELDLDSLEIEKLDINVEGDE